MSPRHRETQLPHWLWFFLILPGVLVVALLWRRRGQQVFRFHFGEEAPPEHYTEPDSIPIEIRAPEGEIQEAPDDLKIIEGIGPAIDGILRDHGISTFRALAGTPLEQLDAILVEAKLRRLADPQTWPEQARLAATGKWDELETLQRSLKAGRRKTGL